MTREIVLEIPARADYLGLARQVVAAAAAIQPRVRDERIEDLRIAVSEATTNAIEAHAHLGSDERILIRCNLGDDRIDVEVLDRGGGFDPGEVESAPAAEDPDRLEWERGLGLPLMLGLADETSIEATDGGTAVRLTVFRPGPAH
ncbi:MAG: ATP-binding protein [Acidimicrobiales bacterium]|nr:ATP-binding protein [Acidimicrobiales bacterium]